LLALMETGAGRRRPRRVALGAAGLILLLAGALLPSLSRPAAGYIIGAKPFSEQYVLAALIQQRLQADGLASSRREGLGSGVVFEALAGGEIDIYVEYTGTIWSNQMQRKDTPARAEVLREVTAWLNDRHGIAVVGGLGFENAYALAMSRKRAEQLGIRSIADLAPHAAGLTIAGDYEFFGRPEWAALRAAYGLGFKSERTMQPEFMYPAAAAGEADVISAYTSDGRIARHDLVVLDDPKNAIPPYDAIILVSRRRAADAALRAALRPLVGAIDVELMRAANLRAAAGAASPDDVARWLATEIARRAKPGADK
jgi:osmoprotectant transport system permease protein